LTQHMQLTVSSTLSAEHRQQLSHSHTAGRAFGVPHAAHLHRPHLTQMMDSVPGERLGPDTTAFSDLSVVGQAGGWVITVEFGTVGGTD